MESGDSELLEINFMKNLDESIFKSSASSTRTLKSLIGDVLKNPSAENYSRCVDKLTGQDLMAILNLIHHKKSSDHFTNDQNGLVQASITFICMKRLLKKWDGFPKHFVFKPNAKFIIDQLMKYLRHNMSFATSIRKQIMKEIECSEDVDNVENETTSEVYEDVILEDKSTGDRRQAAGIVVECPYNKLKTLFFMDTSRSDTTILNKHKEIRTFNEFQLSDFNFESLFNWLFVGITINTPKYKIIYENIHELEHKLVKFHEKYKPLSVDNKVGIFTTAPPNSNSEVIIRPEFWTYLMSLDKSANSPLMNKVIICVGRVFIKIGSLIKTGVSYTLPGKKSYVRYLGQTRKTKCSGPVVNHKRQRNMDKECDLNIRLQEIINPRSFLCIENQEKLLPRTTHAESDDTPSNSESQCTLSNTNKMSISIECKLCNIQYTDGRADVNMKNHLISIHGQEPDWFCVQCNQNFTMKQITHSFWSHMCQKQHNL